MLSKRYLPNKTYVKALMTFILIVLGFAKLSFAQQISTETMFELEIEKFQNLVEKSLVAREAAKASLIEFERAQMQSSPIPPALIAKISNQIIDFKLNIASQLFQVFAEVDVTKPFPSKRYLVIDQNLKTSLALASAVVLYDNYALTLAPLLKNPKLRLILTHQNLNLNNAIETIENSYLDLGYRNKVTSHIEQYNQIKKNAKIAPPQQRTYDYLKQLIETSPFYLETQSPASEQEFAEIGETVENKISGFFVNLINQATHEISQELGNKTGQYESRQGYLKQLPEEVKRKLSENLQPLDVLLEKTPFRLTDKMIPGHFGHVAIWLGSFTQLNELGFWEKLRSHLKNDVKFFQYQDQVKAGHSVLEALRDGVQLNTFEHFLNIDDLLVIKKQSMTEQEKIDYLLKAFDQIGKEYDFNFDVETADKIVCSEIVYVVFSDVNWPTQKSIGRHTISPDQVAIRSLTQTDPFAPILLFHDGVELLGTKENLQLNVGLLLKGQYEQLQSENPNFKGKTIFYDSNIQNVFEVVNYLTK